MHEYSSAYITRIALAHALFAMQRTACMQRTQSPMLVYSCKFKPIMVSMWLQDKLIILWASHVLSLNLMRCLANVHSSESACHPHQPVSKSSSKQYFTNAFIPLLPVILPFIGFKVPKMSSLT